MRNTIIRYGVAAFIARVALGLFFVAVQASSPGEGAMILALDVPTIAAIFAFSFFARWPERITDAYDVTFHVFGVITWSVLGCLIGWAVNKYRSRSATAGAG